MATPGPWQFQEGRRSNRKALTPVKESSKTRRLQRVDNSKVNFLLDSKSLDVILMEI